MDEFTKVVEALFLRLDELTDESVREVRRLESSYRDRVAVEDLSTAARQNLRFVLLTLAGLPLDAELKRLPESIGQRRAEQGVPVDALLHAFRIDFRVLWEAMLAEITGRAPDRLQTFLYEVTRVWAVIDSISVTVGSSYRRAEADIARRDDERRQQLFDALIKKSGSAESVARAVALEFHLSEQDRYVVVHAEIVDGLPALDNPQRALQQAGMRSAWRTEPSKQTGLVEVRRQPATAVVEALRPVARARAGVSPPFPGLARASEYVWLAAAALHAIPPGASGVLSVDNNLVESLVGAAPDLSRHLASAVLNGLEGIRPAERARITETFRAWVEADGSVSAAAKQVCRHRNTALNHLRRLERLTGRSLSSPRDVTELIVAMCVEDVLDLGATETPSLPLAPSDSSAQGICRCNRSEVRRQPTPRPHTSFGHRARSGSVARAVRR